MKREQILQIWAERSLRLRNNPTHNANEPLESSKADANALVQTLSPENWAGAIAEWRACLGAAQVVTMPQVLDAASTATFQTTQRIIAIIKPQNREDVQHCMRIANLHQTPLSVSSQGKNWGYGSRVPVKDQCALLDLSRMNRILAYDESLAYVTIEPGVTYRQLFCFLREKNSALILNSIGSSPDASLVGNALERGIGQGLYADNFAYSCALEVVLPTGECIHTGFEQFENALTAPLHRWGVGPVLDGLFSQSSLGVVTHMTLWLAPLPEHTQLVSFHLENAEELPPLIEALRTLKLRDLPRATLRLMNDFRLITGSQQYPFALVDNAVPLPDSFREMLRKKWKVHLWNGMGYIYSSSPEQAQADLGVLTRHLNGKVHDLTVLDNIPPDKLRYVQDAIPGIPTDKYIASTYWRKKIPLPDEMNPDRDQCGFVWCDLVVPLTGTHVRSSLQLMEQILEKHQFEPNLAIPYTDGRVAYITGLIIYDRAESGEDEKARACLVEIQEKLGSAGYTFPRLDINSIAAFSHGEEVYRQLLGTLKKSIDPGNILSPGRYTGN